MVPINDIRGVESMGYAKGEKIIRCKLAAVFRLMDLYGWTQGIYNQVSVIIDFLKIFINYLKCTSQYSIVFIIITKAIIIFLGSAKSRGRTFFS